MPNYRIFIIFATRSPLEKWSIQIKSPLEKWSIQTKIVGLQLVRQFDAVLFKLDCPI